MAEPVEIAGMKVRSLGDRVNARRVELRLSQQQVADLAGMSQGTVSKIERGETTDPRYLLPLARALRLNPEWLRFERGPKERGAPEPMEFGSDYPVIRRVNLKVSAGISGFTVEPLDDDEEPIAFRSEWFRQRGFNPDALFALKVSGSSMEPGLADGDTVVINSQDKAPRDGGVYAINYDGELVIKRLFRIGGSWVASADNPDRNRYPQRPMHESAFIIGRVVHKQSEHV